MFQTILNTPFTLPCGAVLKNRLAKAAMTEGLANSAGRATARHAQLYRRWAEGGAGLLITGNVLVDRRYLERLGNVIIDGPQTDDQLERLSRYAGAARSGGAAIWMQINHAGRQTPYDITKTPVAPSAVQTSVPGGKFGPPRALEETEIRDIIERFGHAAAVARKTGFDGVQIHAAHGYLLSSFLNPIVNRRTDRWGGSLENRARLLLETVRHVRSMVGADYPVGVKLNSADFQKGGFSLDECVQVAKWLKQEAVDLLEISGGNYESLAMVGMDDEPRSDQPASAQKREAYFLDYADVLLKADTPPLMVTGGFRTRCTMEDAVRKDGVSIIGVARPLCGDPDGIANMLAGKTGRLERWEDRVRLGPGPLGAKSRFAAIRALNGWGLLGWCIRQMHEMGNGRPPDLTFGALGSLWWTRKEQNRLLGEKSSDKKEQAK
jgi:2,4-dienoyl-CoA reductase-like NADH-dependent reductase (Old Yellow Enzyme family)